MTESDYTVTKSREELQAELDKMAALCGRLSDALAATRKERDDYKAKLANIWLRVQSVSQDLDSFLNSSVEKQS